MVLSIVAGDVHVNGDDSLIDGIDLEVVGTIVHTVDVTVVDVTALELEGVSESMGLISIISSLGVRACPGLIGRSIATVGHRRHDQWGS